MRTVPTLCATGSIIGAAGVGCTFGQGQRTPDTPDSSLAGVALERVSRGQQSTIVTPARTTDRFSQGPSSEKTLSPEGRTKQPLTHEAETVKIAFGNPDSAFLTPIKAHSYAEQDSTDFVGRQFTRSQRLTGNAISVSSSPTLSSGQGSRSLVHSFGSGTPFLQSESCEPSRQPNKLVKRSLSQHLVQNLGSGDESRIPPTLDRPATRHKRLVTLSRRSLSEDESGRTVDSQSSSRIYKPFFRLETTRNIPSAAFKQKGETFDYASIRRICPTRAEPILLRPHTVSLAAVEVQDPPETQHNFTFTDFRSRLHHSHGITTFSSPAPSAALNSKYSRPSAEPRRSFSISDLLSWSPSTRKESRKLQNFRSRRVFSAPLFSMNDDRDSKNAEQSQKRKKTGGSSKVRMSGGSQKSPKAGSGEQAAILKTDAARSGVVGVEERSESLHQTEIITTPAAKHSPASNASGSPLHRPSRHSITPSDNASSLVGSDYGGKVFSSADEDEGDKQSDSVYDSLRTGATRSSSGFRGPALETFFDKSHDQTLNRSGTTPFTPARSPGSHLRAQANPSTSNDEDVSNSTPARTVIHENPESRHSSEQNLPRTPTIGSSPPQMPDHLSLGKLGWDSELGDTEDPWSDEGIDENWDEGLSEISDEADLDSRLFNSNVTHVQSSGKSLKQFRSQRSEQEHKNSLFDWSEQPPTQLGQENRPPPRPQTVHGKKNPAGKRSRPTGYRAVSGLHARSQSVPALADLASTRTPITSKFGTWGIGSKGVTEDWNEDFEFEDGQPNQLSKKKDSDGQSPADTSRTMVVPDSIRAQQTNVLANIGLLKEWGLLIEDLKELRKRTVALNLESDRYIELFDEVDAMIDLADQEVEDEGLPQQRSPRQFPVADLEGVDHWSSSPLAPKLTRSGGLEDDVFGTTSTPHSSTTYHTPEKDTQISTTRPRKNSEAIAESVIRALQAKGKSTRSASLDRERHRKVPFDTATLRHIVPYVNGLSKKMRQILRDAEGLQTKSSPRRREGQHSPEFRLRQAFVDPDQMDPHEGTPSLGKDDTVEDPDEASLVSLMTMTKIE